VRPLHPIGFVLALLCAATASAHSVYLAPANHVDYNWNATAAQYDAAMLSELDYYLAQVDATAASPAAEQSRYIADSWWWLYLYEQNRTPAEFADLIGKIASGHITVPLNPFVTLYGAMSTEMAIRAGYYPGRIARAHGVGFPLAFASVENATVPWGLASLFAGSDVHYTWKGVCDCVTSAPHHSVPEELFHWEGADGKTLLMKWYRLTGSNQDRGGYSEARQNQSVAAIDGEIAQTQANLPGISVTGLFGAGWDDVSYENQDIVNAVVAYNASASPDSAVVSNGVDFFEDLEASGEAASLPTLRGGWGNDWDMWPISLAERTARQRRAIERLRTAEALAVFAQWSTAGFWPPVQASLETALTSTWKFFEHGWNVTGGGPTLAQMAADKETWTLDIESAVDNALTSAETAFAALFSTPDEDRVAVFNPLAFARTDVVDLAVANTGPWVVTDVATGTEVPSQVVTRDGQSYLRWLATGVPSLGYRVYRYELGTPTALPDVATLDTVGRSIESDLYRVVLGPQGQLTSAVEKSSAPDVELAGGGGFNVWGNGSSPVVSAENVGPVSATLRMDLLGTDRSVRVTLHRDVDRVEIENEIVENIGGFEAYDFDVAMTSPQIRFEELGAIARPGLVSQGGDFLGGTRASRMTVNHFVAFEEAGYHIVLSNWDAYAMRVGASTDTSFDLGGSRISMLVSDSPSGAGVTNQGGDDRFLNRFSLRGASGPFSGPEAMRTSLAHQNPLRAVALPRNQTGPLVEAQHGFLSVTDPDVVVTAFKPVEEAARGFMVRLWELSDQAASFEIEASAFQPQQAFEVSVIETDIAPVALASGRLSAQLDANEIAAFRFEPTPLPEPSQTTLLLAGWASLAALARRRAARLRGRSERARAPARPPRSSNGTSSRSRG
jgi:alpha-mannosidase